MLPRIATENRKILRVTSGRRRRWVIAAIAAGSLLLGVSLTALADDSSSMPDPCTQPPPPPLPAPGSAGSQGAYQSFHTPLPQVSLWNLSDQPPRVGLQVGHWQLENLPPELAGVGAGASYGGVQEWQVNLAIAQGAAAFLQADGVAVDVLPATVPPHYQANVFVAIHADGDTSGEISGFKVARPGFSSVPDWDDQLVSDLNGEYGATTGLPRDDAHISLRMSYYYAFNSRRYCHAVSVGVPQAIIETGYMTNASDQTILFDNPNLSGQGIALSVEEFLAQEGHPVGSFANPTATAP